jgi:20S proteasome subunit alpha 6
MGEESYYNNYLIFNPEGKVKQLEYIHRTTELGNTVVGLRNSRYGLLIAHNQKVSELADAQKKIFPIGKTALFTFSGITNDGLCIVDYLIDKVVTEEVIKGRNIHFLDVFRDLCYDACSRTLISQNRLYGVSGLFLTWYDGVRLVEFDPKGIVREVHAMSLGNRRQSCRTVLETECGGFEEMDLDGLIQVGIQALRNAHPEQGELTSGNVEIWVLDGNNESYTVEAEPYLN